MPDAPPQAIEAERAVIGSMILDAKAIWRAALRLRAADFYVEANRRVFTTIEDLVGEGYAGVDLIIVTERLRRDQTLAAVGGPGYLDECVRSVALSENVEYYAGLVRERSLERQVNYQLTKTADDPTPEAVGKLGDLILQLQGNRPGRIFDFRHDIVAMVERLVERDQPPLIRTGFGGLDNYMWGLEAGDLVTVGSRTSGGKTAMMTRLMCNMAMEGHECLYFTSEMDRRQMVMRILPMATRIPFWKYRARRLNAAEADLARAAAADDLARLPIRIVDKSRLRIDDIRGCVVDAAPDVVFIDYLQRCELPKSDNRAYAIEEFMVQLKSLTLDLKIRTLIAAQLDRGLDRDPDKPPVLADLRGSGAIEHESDFVLLGWRPSEKDLAKRVNHVPASPGCVAMEWIIGKARSGVAGVSVDFELNGDLIAMAERLAHRPPEEESSP